MKKVADIVPSDNIESFIRTIRGQKVILADDLARLYGVPTKRLNEQVKRNRERFPDDFKFQLSREEAEMLRRSRSQIATLKRGGNGVPTSAHHRHGTAERAGVALEIDRQ